MHQFRHRTLFDHLLRSGSELPALERSVDRLTTEAQVILGAGTVTTARAMSFTTVHILLNQRVKQKLIDELKNAGAEAMLPRKLSSYTMLKRLPYLNACVKEGLRYVLPMSGPHVVLSISVKG